MKLKWERNEQSNDSHWVSVQIQGVVRRIRQLGNEDGTLPHGIEWSYDGDDLGREKLVLVIDPEVFGWRVTNVDYQ